MSDRRVILVHGFASWRSGRLDIDKLTPYFRQAEFEIVNFDYGFHFLVTPNNSKWAARLAAMIQPNDVIVAHSNGCLITQLATLITPAPPIRALALLNPAMDDKVQFGPQVNTVDVFYTPFDLPIRFGSFLPFGHPWGTAGVRGVTTGDHRIRNHDMTRYAVPIRSHLGIFQSEALSFWGPAIVRAVERRNEAL